MSDISTNSDVLDGPLASTSYWTTVNAREALPGVSTPMNWSWYGDATELSFRRTFNALGVLGADQVVVPSDVHDRFFAVFNGHAAINVDRWRYVSDVMPGTSGDAMERQFFGSVRDGVQSNTSRRRYPVIALRFPAAAMRCRKAVLADRIGTETWWRSSITALKASDSDIATRFLLGSRDRFISVGSTHMTCSMITQAIYQQICALTQRSGLEGLERRLVTGYGAFEETLALQKLWAISRGATDTTIAEVIEEFGYIGPGEISAHSWREDAAPVRATAARFAALSEDRSLTAGEERQRRERRTAEQRLLTAVPALSRPKTRMLLGALQRFMPTREIGRASVLMCLDVARAAARVIGRDHAQRGALDTAEDIFYLTIDEATGPLEHASATDLVRARRDRRRHYLSLTMPEAWTGRPEPVTAPDCKDLVVRGIGVTDGVVEGTARVVRDPMDAEDFDDGDILVCAATDPSWASLFMSAGGVVIDIGGPLSHGAIVARELGLPCVINTKDGTRRIKSGDRITIDGGAGQATITRASAD